ncbi:hypothetical protein NCZ17_01490 [Acinetobacter modestus]|uniref:hypothetical protein n=1 Tax=Acinetobacter modestus TaxID=1776740 RepID=UPI00202E924B|nr:hypothetical protein [Acinetobacter modestus]MCM1958046.1 hypothetical protein [Acinetobacter modestus]
MYGMQRPKKDGQSELIEGQGTGTSDSIKKNVPAGSFIMPADSTQKIGPKNLKKLGSPQPVNLSNGEFQIPPEQVHQVGVQALEQIKDATHTPVPDQQGFGFKPELFFANGGLVPFEEEAIRRQQNKIGGPQMRDVTPVNRQLPVAGNAPTTNANVKFPQFNTPTTGQMLKSSLGNGAKGLGAFHFAASGIGGAVTGYNTPTEDYRERFGMQTDDPSLAGDLGVRGLGVLSDVGNAASFGMLGRNFADKQRINAENANAAQQKRFDEWNAKKNSTVANPFGQEAKPTTMANTPAANSQNPQQQNPYAIQQNGNSFSYANPGAAAQAREQGIQEGQASNVIGGIRRTNDPRGVANLFANTREMGPTQEQIDREVAQLNNFGMRGLFGGITQPNAPQRTPEQEAERQQLIRMATIPVAGARGITANQMRMMGELQQGDDNRAQQRYVTDANNAASVMQTGMREIGQTGRTAMQEQGTNDRFGANLGFDAQKFQATNDLANREFNLNAAEKGFGIRNSARVEKLYEQLDTAKTDEDRKSIQEKINRYIGGKADTGKDRYMTIGGGQEWNDKSGTMVNRPQQLFDTQTQQFVNTPAASSTNLPSGMTRQVGTSNGKPVYEDAQGNRFIGN